MKRMICLCVALCMMLSAFGSAVTAWQPQTVQAASPSSVTGCLPLIAYTRSTGRVTTYSSVNGDATGYIDGNTDRCTVKAFLADWVLVNYPVPGGTKDAYCPLSEFLASGNTYADYYVSDFAATAYRRSSGGATIGSVYVGDHIYLIASENGRTQLAYNVSGGWKLGWVDSGYTNPLLYPPQPAPQPEPEPTPAPQSEPEPVNTVGGYSYAWKTPLKAYTRSTGRVTTYSSVNGGESGYITGSSDLCTIQEIYTSGWVKVTYPLDRGGSKTAFAYLSDFIYDTGFGAYTRDAAAGGSAYRRESGISEIGSVYQNDSLTVVSAANGRYQVIYNITGTSSYKLGWVVENVLTAPSQPAPQPTPQPAVPSSQTENAPAANVIGGVSYAAKVPLSSYTISTDKVKTFVSVDGEKSGYINGKKDLCTILEIYKSGWVKVSYPLDTGGRKTAYARLSDFVQDTSYSTRVLTMPSDTTAYRRANGQEPVGSVDKNDEITVVSEKGNRYQVVYPLRGGGWKLGWIERSAVNPPAQQGAEKAVEVIKETPIPQPTADKDNPANKISGKAYAQVTPIKAYTLSSGKVDTFAQVGDTTPFGYISGSVDLCTILEIYESGWVKVNYPLSGGKTKTGYCHLSDFISHTDFQEYPVTAPSFAFAYRRSTGNATIGEIHEKDDLIVVSSENNRTQVVYPAVGCHKLGWVEAFGNAAAVGAGAASNSSRQEESVSLTKDTRGFRAKTPMYTYTLRPENVPMFDKPGGAPVGSVDGTRDLCTILEIYTNQWAKVRYPLDSGGTRTLYCELKYFLSDSLFSKEPVEGEAPASQPVYRRKTGQPTIGSVTKGEPIWVIATPFPSLRKQILYHVDGTSDYKIGWIDNVVSESSETGGTSGEGQPTDAYSPIKTDIGTQSELRGYTDASSNAYAPVPTYPRIGAASDGYVEHQEEITLLGYSGDYYYIDYLITEGSHAGQHKQRFMHKDYFSAERPSDPDAQKMLEALRAKAMAYTTVAWKPAATVSSWSRTANTNFKAGKTYYGVPYTMHGSFYSLQKFKSLIDQNQVIDIGSNHANDRYGPRIGNCCASMLADMYGLVNSGGNLTVNGCGALMSQAASYGAKTTYSVKFDDIQPGDAMLDTEYRTKDDGTRYAATGHVVFIYDIDRANRKIRVIEQTPSKARDTGWIDAKVDGSGYWQYGSYVYNKRIRLNVMNYL